MEEMELKHHGVKGQRWGVRRFQNKDGSLTPAGKKHQAGTDGDAKKEKPKKEKPKKIKDLSDEELKSRVKRLELEKQCKDLEKKRPYMEDAKKIAYDLVTKHAVDVAITISKNALIDIGSQFASYCVGTAINDTFGDTFGDDKIVDPKLRQKKK